MKRRLFLRNSVAAAGAVIAGASAATASSPTTSSAGRSIRIAHLTDTHVFPDRKAPEKLRQAIRHCQSQADCPDLLIFGGDCIMDALKQTEKDVATQWNLWREIIADEVKIPVRYCLGNHDVWGWALPDREAIINDPRYGKGWALEVLGLERSYYAFDIAGWRMLVLDSSNFDPKNEKGYIARLDEEQFGWLESTLAATSSETPVCVVSHIPIVSFCPFFDGDNETSGDWVVPGQWMHIDARRIKDLFTRYPNVRACLSGHIHLADRVDYLGVTHHCNGAVSGAWWKGAYQEFGPAYYLVDLFEDGSSKAERVEYLAQ